MADRVVFFCRVRGLGGKKYYPTRLKGKVYCPLVQGWRAAILHNTCYETALVLRWVFRGAALITRIM